MITLTQWLGYTDTVKKGVIEHYAMKCDLTGEQEQRLLTSLPVVTMFFVEAHMIAKKKDHYSARTIIEVIRHNSVVEDSDSTFKINNDITKPLAIISMEIFPALNALFSVRSHTFGVEK